MNERCDGKIDCPADSSDEDNCHLFVLNPGYKSTFPPSTNEENDKAQVKVSIHIKNVAHVKELSMEFEVCVKIIMEWYDQRIDFRNLKKDEKLNVINSKELRDSLWLPSLLFQNSNSRERTQIDEEASLVVRRLGKSKPNDLTEIHEDSIYSGSENPLILSRYYTVKLNCLFELKYYPFDKQRCPIMLEIPFELKTQMNLTMEKEPTHDHLDSFYFNYTGVDGQVNGSGVIVIVINMVR